MLAKYYFLAFLKPCALHIKRNLIHHGFSSTVLQSLYWEATNAYTKSDYNIIMDKMRISENGKGYKLATFLESITNWRLFEAIERGNILYEMKTNNLVEGVFSWLEEVRSFATPYYIICSLMKLNISRINSLYEEVIREDLSLGLTTWYHMFYTLNII
jgi:hypothetical protein